MKKTKIALSVIAALALCACTNDDNFTTDDSTNVTQVGDGYVSFTINLPTQPSSRTANDDYKDGDPAEYTVNDATLLLFKGESEKNATFYATYSLSNSFSNENVSSNENITQKANVTQKISRPSLGNIYALVVFNGKGMFDSPTNPTTFGGVTLANATLSELQSTAYSPNIDDVANVKDSYFYMTNAPLYTKQGGTKIPSNGKVITLAEIDQSQIYTTKEEAQSNPAINIYVERGVSKVTVNDKIDGFLNPDEENKVPVTIEGYVLDLTNSKMFPVRNSTNDDEWWGYRSTTSSSNAPYRFVGNVEVGADLYRTYWAKDPNYTDTKVGELNNLAGTAPTLASDPSLRKLGQDNPSYCFENTFNVKNMDKDETTRMIVAAKIGDGQGFFCINGSKTVMYTKEEAAKYALSVFESLPDVEDAYNLYKGNKNFFEECVVVDLSTDKASDYSDVSITFNGFNSADFEGNVLPDVFNADNENATYQKAIEAVKAHEFSYFAGGISYYPVLIKHFGDDLTPWDEAAAQENNESYYGENAEQSWLGRYGMLRNNWYDINVTAIRNIGFATIPDARHEPDDPIDSYISVEINVLSWAYRTQNVQL